MDFRLFRTQPPPPRFIVAVGSEATRTKLEAQLSSVPNQDWNYVVAVETAAVLALPRDDRRQFMIAEYDSANLDLTEIVSCLRLPLLLLSYGSEPIAERHLQSSAVYCYHANPSIEELRIAISTMQWIAHAAQQIELDSKVISAL